MTTWATRKVRIGGRTIAVRDFGAPEWPAVLLLHGLGTHQRSWNRVAKKLGGRRRVLTFDYRGHGRSDPADEYSVDGLLADLQAVIDQAGVTAGYILVGHSLGADVALLHASQTSGCAGIVLVDGALMLAPPAADWERFFMLENRVLFKALMFLGRRFGSTPSLTIRDVRSLTEDVEAQRAHFDVLLSKLPVPALYVIGNQPDKVPDGSAIHDRKMRAVSAINVEHPDVRVEYVPCGHLVPMRQSERLAELIREFADSLEP